MMKILFLFLFSSLSFLAKADDKFLFRVNTSTLGWINRVNPEIELNLKPRAIRHGGGVLVGRQEIKFFNTTVSEYVAGFYQYTNELLNLRAGYVYGHRYTKKYLSNDFDHRKGSGALAGLQVRYGLIGPFIVGHGLDLMVVKTKSGDGLFSILDITVASIGFEF